MTFLIQQTMLYAIPLMIVALAGVFAERSGIINLALEGIMIFGAFIGVLFVNLVQQAGHPDDLIIFGAAFDEELEDEIRVTVIATGFEEKKPKESAAGSAAASGDSSKERFDNMFLKPKEEEKEESDPFDDILRIFSNDR